MEKLSPLYQRARVFMLRDILSKVDPKAQHAALMRNGVFPPERDEQQMVQVYQKERDFSNEPLSFTELCTFNTWFSMHPEKVCGNEKISSSREFPLTIEGDKNWIESTIGHALGDGQLILDLPGLWYIDFFDADNEDFFASYKYKHYHITVFAHGVEYNVQIFDGDTSLENTNYQSIEKANVRIQSFMENFKKDYKSQLELEALALELELQLMKL